MNTIITRETQRPEVAYVDRTGFCFVSPDGVGRFYFDSLEEAQEEMDHIAYVHHVDGWRD